MAEITDDTRPASAPSHSFISNAGCSANVTPTKLIRTATISGHSTWFLRCHQPMQNRAAAIQIGAM